jgi:hypothetical protein
MSEATEKIRNPIPPTVTDLKILAYMDNGNYIDDERGRQLFNTFGLRDVIFRLRKAGNIVMDRWVYYNTKSGVPKKYKQWFTKEPEILPAGKLVETNLPNELKHSEKPQNKTQGDAKEFPQGKFSFVL